MHQSSGRRVFVKQFFLGSATSMLAGSVCTMPMLAEATPTGASRAVFRVSLVDFPVLNNVGGSVRLRYSSAWPAVAVNRGTGSQFYALNLECPHQGCTVGAYNATSGTMTCPCHFSRFTVDGTRISGPAPHGLAKYPAAFDGNGVVSFEIPGVRHCVDFVALQSRGVNGTRLRLRFSALPEAKYQVLLHADLHGAPVVTAFATGPADAADKTLLQTTTAQEQTVYVDSADARAFYTIALLLEPYVE